jgi:hypothetical protein
MYKSGRKKCKIKKNESRRVQEKEAHSSPTSVSPLILPLLSGKDERERESGGEGQGGGRRK